MRRALAFALLSACAVPRGALDPSDSSVRDTSSDALDASADANDANTPDVGVDSGPDLDGGVDAAMDAEPDAFDAGMDAGPPDTGPDAGPPCLEDPIVHWDFGSATPLADLADSDPRVDLTWLPAEGFITAGAAMFLFDRLVATQAASTEFGDALESSDRFTIEGWIGRASGLTPVGGSPMRIFSCSRDTLRRAFTIGQRDDELIFRMRSTNTDENGDEVRAPFFPTDGPRHFAVTWDGRRTRIYVDGVFAAVDDHGGGADFVAVDEERCRLGDEGTLDRPFNGGSIFSLRVFDYVIEDADIACFATSAP